MRARPTMERKRRLNRIFARRKNRRIKTRAISQSAPRMKEHKRRPSLSRVAKGVLKKTLKLLAVLFVVTAIGAGGFYSYRRVMASNYFSVVHLEFDGVKHANPQELKRLVSSSLGRHILTVDLKMLERSVRSHPWVKSVQVSRELPRTIRFKIEEHTPRALLLMGHLYLVSRAGRVFKRADFGEQGGLPVVTGIERLTYINHPQAAHGLVKRALKVLDIVEAGRRLPLSEVHITPAGDVTLFLERGGAAIRLGRTVRKQQLLKLDQVLAALGPEAEKARIYYLDNEAHTERVTVRMNTAQ